LGDTIIPAIGIPVPVSPRIHDFEDYIAVLGSETKREIRE